MTDQLESEIDREQVEIALEILEAFHGDALKRPWSRDANAFYHAIGIVEDALEGAYDPDKPPAHQAWQQDLKRSREAREEGYRAATCLGETTTHVVKKEDREDNGLMDAFRRIFT